MSYADDKADVSAQQSEPSSAARPAKPARKLPFAVVRAKRKAEPPEADGSAEGVLAKKQQAENGGVTALRAEPANPQPAKEDSDDGAVGLGGLAAYGTESD